ncbi:MAG: hypothetical protein LBB29_02290 [Holosporaceae bacterium]|jgi:hypothetical protein|nr:hypothetical protein [Holosporaceae bacterium]
MKLEFKNINDSHITAKSVFYLYGNYKKTLGVFCDFILEKFMACYQCPAENIDVFSGSVTECLKSMSEQCDLFNNRVVCFCMRGVEDSHLEKISPLLEREGNIFILESGDYAKSKKITDYFQKSKFPAVASFKSDITLYSLCRMLIPAAPSSVTAEIVKIINNSDEDLRSLFKKISILVDAHDYDLLQEYVTYKSTFFQQLDFIPMVRYMLNMAIKEKIYERKQEGMSFSRNNIVQSLLKSEISQKFGKNLGKSYLYEMVQIGYVGNR